jgi:hypothetical protein
MDYVKGCADCQHNKVNTHTKKAVLSPIFARPEALPFETVAMDFIVKLPLSEGYDSILTITDHDCTKMTIFIPCNESISAEGVARLYLQHIFKNYGLPRKIISDHDTRFTGKFMRELCRILGIQQNMSTAYHPRTDGQSERSNQWIEQFFRFYIDEDQKNWASYLPLAEFAHNSWRNESTGQTPFEILMGYSLRAEWTTAPSPIPQVTLRLDQFKRAREQAQCLMRKAQQGWEKHKREGQTFQEGDQVWLEGCHIKTHQPMAKLGAKRHGPFKITRVLSPLNYQLELPAQWKIHNVFHVDLLTPYRETDFHGHNYERPPPDLINGEEEYEIEHMIDLQCHGRGGKIQYLIKWKGYPDSENQWVSWDDVNAPELLAEFKERNPNALSHIRGVVGDENLTSLGFPPATVRSSLTPALQSFIQSTLSNMSNASHTSAYEGSIARVNTPSSVSESDSDKENVAPIPIPPHTATPFSGESAIHTVLGIETPQNAHEYDTIFRVLRAMRADDEETGRPCALADITGRAIVLEEHTSRDGGVYSTTSVPAADARIRPPPRTETPPPLGFHCNRGHDYVPFLITAEDGRQWPARWVQLTLADNPYMVGFRANDDHLYGGPIHAAPDFDILEKPTYSQEDIIVFKPGFEGAACIDMRRSTASMTWR